MNSPAFANKEAAQAFARTSGKGLGMAAGALGLAAMSKYKVGKMTKARL